MNQSLGKVRHSVSMVADAGATETRDADAVKVVHGIRTGRWRKAVEYIRQVYTDTLAATCNLNEAKQAVAGLKKKLPGVMWSGRFTSRRRDDPEKLVQHSGLICADLDDLGDRCADVRITLSQSPHLFALFTSPKGTGLKAVFRVPADKEKHAVSYQAVEKHVLELTTVKIDGACKDVGRMCFVSYDPDAVLNADAVELPVPEPTLKRACVESIIPSVSDIEARRRIATELLGTIQWTTNTAGFCRCPGQQLHTAGDGERDCEVHLDGTPTIHCFHNSCAGIREGVNHQLRSRIGKSERPKATKQGSVACEYLGIADCPPLEIPPYTPPPLDLLPGELEDYVLAASDALGVDVSYIFLPLLSALGMAVGNSRVVQLKPGFVQPPIIWTAIIGRSGWKKSPALDEGTFPIRDRERDFIRQNIDARQEYERQLAEWEATVRKERGLKPVLPPMRTGLMDDLTLASLAAALAENPSGLLVKKDELSHWFESFDQFTKAQGADVSRWLSLHTGVLFAYDRKTDRERYRLFHPRVCIAGGIQFKTLRRCLTEDFFDRGLPARFIFAWPPGQQDRWTEITVPKNVRETALKVFNRLFALAPLKSPDGEMQPKVLTLDAAAKAEYVDFYNSVGADAINADEREEAAWHKLTGYAARFALVGALARGEAECISGSTMRAATALARWCGAESRRIYASLAESSETAVLRQLCEFISRRGGEVTVRDVVTYYWPLKNKSDLAEAQLQQLATSGLGEWVPVSSTPKGGKPTRRFRLFASVVPHLHLQNPEIPKKKEGIADADEGKFVQNAPIETKPGVENSESVLSASGLEQAEPSPDCATVPAGTITETQTNPPDVEYI